MIEISIVDHLAIIKLNRPERKNALSIELLKELCRNLDSFEKNHNVRAALLHGGKDFSAGGDINDMQVADFNSAQAVADEVQSLFYKISNFKKPLIAFLSGSVMGGGIELALTCDFCLAHSAARFAMPEPALGLIPGGGATQRLPFKIGRANAAFVLLAGQTFDATQMQNFGLVQMIVDNFELAQVWATKLASQEPNALQSIKALLKQNLNFENESLEFAKCLIGNGRIGIQSFLNEKKPPVW